jgi:hypothetical protein
MKCKNCNKETNNPKFCSKSCSATFNNMGVRRHGNGMALLCKCGNKKSRASKQCKQCLTNEQRQDAYERPISFYLNQKSHSRFKHNRVRGWGKKVMEIWNIPKKCVVCGYDLHVECCHKTPISDFPVDTKMKVVNSEENLVYLCRNHHWEFDNNYLKL